MKKILFAGVVILLAATNQAMAGDSCVGLIHVGLLEWTTVAGFKYLGSEHSDNACKFLTKSAKGQRILKVCPDGSHCNISYADVDENGLGMVLGVRRIKDNDWPKLEKTYVENGPKGAVNDNKSNDVGTESKNTLEADLLKLIKQQYPNVDTDEGLEVDGPNVSPRQVAFYIPNPNAHMACRFTENPLKIFNCRQVHG